MGEADNNADMHDAAAVLTVVADEKLEPKSLPFSHVNASFWLEIVQCSNRRQNLVPDETSTRFV